MKALFLDRDGVLNVDKGYVGHIADFEFIPGVFDALRAARDLGYVLIVVTNQAGIARGFYTQEEYFQLTEWMLEQFQTEGVTITEVYHCPYHRDGVVAQFTGESEHRKPNPGMLLSAARDHGLTLSESILIGDKESDVEAGRRAGVALTVRVDPEGGASTQADEVVRSIADLPELLARFSKG